MSVYLTFDIGTTALKTALTTDDGNVIAIHTEEYAFDVPRPGWAEMPPTAYWDAVVAGTRKVFKESGANASALKAIGFSSQGQSFIPIDQSGRALYNAIVWLDGRAKDIAHKWESTWLSREAYRRISGYPRLFMELTVFKIAWLADQAPEAHQAWKFLCLPDYLIYQMTGEIATDRVMAQFTGMYDLQTSDWEPWLLDAAGITKDQLPALLEPGAVAGKLRQIAADELGVPAGVPVCVGANDQLAGAVGAGNVSPGTVSETTGTVMAMVATTPTQSDDAAVFTGKHAVPDCYFSMTNTMTSGIVLKWFRDLCEPGQSYDEFLAGVASVPEGSDGLTVLPHFSGTGFPDFNTDARGAIIGLTMGHSREHIARAIMESCCCQIEECLARVFAHGRRAESIRSLGVAARSDVWLQMKADMLGIPVERPVCSEAGSLGAAMLAATGVGQFDGLHQASLTWYRADRTFEPNPEKYSRYRGVCERYRRLTRLLCEQQ